MTTIVRGPRPPELEQLLVVDWQERSVRCFALQDGQAERSEVLDLTTAEVSAAVDWPELDA